MSKHLLGSPSLPREDSQNNLNEYVFKGKSAEAI